ncbi:MAG TPA: GMC family oxidoreductase [Egibacteraceae bacterium]|nr:GMC family oxidoreductase [Egibacteraceae bacterium]
MQEHPEVDVVTVGAGWTAAIIAQQLTAEGLSVVSIERGKAQWTWPDFAHNHDYLKYANRYEMMHDLSKESWTWRPNTRLPSLPMRQYGSFHPGQGLGGAGVHWTCQTWRFLPMDFRYRSHHIERYGEDKLPEGNTIQDWPVTYAELEPYYDQWEYDTGISGKAGNLNGEIIERGNIFEGPRSREFPLPPLRTTLSADLFREACEDIGHHPFVQPSSILSESYVDMSGQPRAACLYCGHCTRFGCEVDAKASPLTAHIPMALDTGRYEVRTHSTVVGIEVNDRGLATGLRYIDRHGREHFQPAARVFVTAYQLTNTRLLLLSRSDAHPNGVGNDENQVGRNYSYQIVRSPAVGVFEGRRFNTYMGNGATREIIYDFQADLFDHADLDFIGGAYISGGIGERDPVGGAEDIPMDNGNGAEGEGNGDDAADLEGEARMWGQQFKDALVHWDSHIPIGIHGESMAFEQNFCDLDPNYTDAYGLPLLRITYDFTENDRNMYRFLAQRCAEIMRAMNPTRMEVTEELGEYNIHEYQSTHNTGGCIMGSNPGNSVTNKYGQVWDTPNVFVTGAALYPQNPGANPTETLCALIYYTLDVMKRHYLNRPDELMT